MMSGKAFRTVRDVSWNLDARIDEMGRNGVDTQVLSPMPELMLTWAPPTDAARYAVNMNSWLADAVRDHPGHFEGFGVVPIQELESATRMLADVRRMGLRGVLLPTNVDGVSLADVRFGDFYREAAALELCLFVHAFHPIYGKHIDRGRANAAVTFPIEIGFYVSAMIANNMLVDGLKLLVSHGGGSAPHVIDRLAWVWSHDEEVRQAISTSPYEQLKQIHYDSLTFSSESLERLGEMVGFDRIMIGSDYPFLSAMPGFNVSGLSPGKLARVQKSNALEFLGISPERRADSDVAAGTHGSARTSS
jgi:aminocarboxymuconate-semialdehyde decarboxylase